MKTITITGINNRYQIKKILNQGSTPITKKKYNNIIKQHPTIVEITSQYNTLNDILTKRQPGKYKDDANIGTIGYNTTKSFVNNSRIY